MMHGMKNDPSDEYIMKSELQNAQESWFLFGVLLRPRTIGLAMSEDAAHTMDMVNVTLTLLCLCLAYVIGLVIAMYLSTIQRKSNDFVPLPKQSDGLGTTRKLIPDIKKKIVKSVFKALEIILTMILWTQWMRTCTLIKICNYKADQRLGTLGMGRS